MASINTKTNITLPTPLPHNNTAETIASITPKPIGIKKSCNLTVRSDTHAFHLLVDINVTAIQILSEIEIQAKERQLDQFTDTSKYKLLIEGEAFDIQMEKSKSPLTSQGLDFRCSNCMHLIKK